MQSTTDIARVTPGVTMAFYGGFLQPAIRGITSTGANLGENSNVAMYIDGVYQPQQVATLIDLPDIEQIEVLKGPQGALYGQNATGGAILVRSMSPSDTLAGKFSASYGNYSDKQARGYLSMLSPRLPASFRLPVCSASAYVFASRNMKNTKKMTRTNCSRPCPKIDTVARASLRVGSRS